jgi:glycerophosphoryl diester phosphodiesterase
MQRNSANAGSWLPLTLVCLSAGLAGGCVLQPDARASGLKVHAWTFRAENAFLPASLRSGEAPGDSGALEEEIDLYLEAGIEGVFTDNPDVAVRVRTHREGRQ